MSLDISFPGLVTPRTYSAAVDPAVTDDLDLGFRAGDIWINTASGNVFDAVSVADGAAVWRHRPRILGMSGVASTHTGNTSETTVATITVPAGAMGANGTLRIRYIGVMNNDASNKQFQVRFSTISGTIFDNTTLASVNGAMREVIISNRNATNSQVGRYSATGTGGWASFGTIGATASVDTTAATTVVITVVLADGTDTAGVDWYCVELLRP